MTALICINAETDVRAAMGLIRGDAQKRFGM
jgi:hypothetical protein